MLHLFLPSRTAAQDDHTRQFKDMTAKLEAIDKSLATIEFQPDGTIITANNNFLKTVGYSLPELAGKHHSVFVDEKTKNSAQYQQFWQRLNRGEFTQGEFKRFNKSGQEIWLQATYNPLMDQENRVYKVIKFATDITQEKMQSTDYSGQISAINRSLAVIEFDTRGNILSANKNFLATMGYSLAEIKGKHHRLFVSPEHAQSDEYHDFWKRLGAGTFESGEFMRIDKNGKEVWIQASYNPILDTNGQPLKVVKYASDITAQKLQSSDYSSQIEAIGKSQAIIEFNLDGTIITANENFLNCVDYSLHEVQGKHHSLFVDSETRDSPDYRRFWDNLRQGQYQSGEFKRIAKGGKDVWIIASYNPILDPKGAPFKIVKYATDVTDDKIKQADFSGQISAISKSQAVIEFNMDGTIIQANDNFLHTMNYTLDEVKGKHHSLFVDATARQSSDYRAFWQKLNLGEFISGEFKRVGKHNKEVWIQASYNPILDLNGKPFKVVKYASDITQEKARNADVSGQLEAISKAQAVIEFELDGTIRKANQNFLSTMGYTLSDIKGKHHSIFVEKDYKESPEYAQFWQILRQGQFVNDEFKRIGNNGKIVWIQASYNPIFDVNGKPIKVVKYATDITDRKLAISSISDALFALSDGDLTKTIDTTMEGEFDLLRQAMNSTLQRLCEMFKEIIERSNHVSTSAQEVQSGSFDLSQRTEEQAASLEETAASVEELTSTVSRNANNANTANKLAIAATEKAQLGGAVINNTINAMAEIEIASKKISDIISVIDEIAFQTNLLALNAAVEAARAGEQGRGFAVVAGEVRNLAQRSAAAAKQIKGLINDSVEKVADGTELANKSGKTLTEIVEAIKAVSDLVTKINAASQEQATGIQQVNTTVTQMDTMTQQNAAMVEEASAASKSMTDQAEELIKLISFFRIA
ncbi:MAG TPA: PAS domain-containing protein [Marinagarivorans sp.]